MLSITLNFKAKGFKRATLLDTMLKVNTTHISANELISSSENSIKRYNLRESDGHDVLEITRAWLANLVACI